MLKKLNYYRLAWHIGGGFFVVIALLLGKPSKMPAIILLSVVSTLLVAMDLLRARYPKARSIFWRSFGFLTSEKDIRVPNTSTYFALSLLVTLLFAPFEIAESAALSLSVGDPIATFVGSNWGRARLRGKSLEAALCNFAAVFFLVQFVVRSKIVAVTGAAAGALLEFLPVPFVDDNLLIPIATACAMILVSHFLGVTYAY